MAQQFISLIKFRRGSNESGLREATTFQEGEPVYETDTQRTFIGTGSTTPGEKNTVLMGNKVFWDNGQITDTESFTIPGAYGNDILYKNNKLWLKASDDRSSDAWIDINPKLESGKLKYNEDNEITIEDSAITYNAGWGIRIVNNTISVRTDSLSPLVINAADELSMREGGIRYNFINQESFDQSVFLFDDTNSLISLKLNSAYFNVTSSGISIIDVPREPVENVFKSFVNQSENYIIEFNNNGALTLSNNIKKLNVDESNIIGAKLGVDNIGIVNDSSDTSYNGSIENTDVPWGGNTRKTIRVYTDNYNPSVSDITAHGEDAFSVLIKSAGFITLDGGYTAGDRQYKKYAVPVYELPDEPVFYCLDQDDSPYYFYGTIFGKNLSGGRFINDENQIGEFFRLNQCSEFSNLNLSDDYQGLICNINRSDAIFKTLGGNLIFDLDNQKVNPNPLIATYEEVSTDNYNINLYIDNSIGTAQYSAGSKVDIYTLDETSGIYVLEQTFPFSNLTFSTVYLRSASAGPSICKMTNSSVFSLHNSDISYIEVTIYDMGENPRSIILDKESGRLFDITNS